jgi:hypothetical protein
VVPAARGGGLGVLPGAQPRALDRRAACLVTNRFRSGWNQRSAVFCVGTNSVGSRRENDSYA